MTTVVRRTVRGDRMEVSMECRGVTATAVFRRKEVIPQKPQPKPSQNRD